MAAVLRQRFSYLKHLAAIVVGFVSLNLFFNLVAVAYFGYAVHYNLAVSFSWQVNALISMFFLALFPALFDGWIADFACALVIGGSTANVLSRSLWPGVPDYLATGDKVMNCADLTLIAGQALLLVAALLEIRRRIVTRRRG